MVEPGCISSAGLRRVIGCFLVLCSRMNAIVPHTAGTRERDRVVDEGGCGGDGSADAVEDEHADHAAVEDADPAGVWG